MIEFTPFEAKPITRMAFQITSQHEWVKVEESIYFIQEDTEHTTNTIRFRAYEEPKVGDWVVRLTAEDTYHVTDSVFRERNIVPE